MSMEFLPYGFTYMTNARTPLAEMQARAEAAEARVRRLEDALRYHKVTGHPVGIGYPSHARCLLCSALDS